MSSASSESLFKDPNLYAIRDIISKIAEDLLRSRPEGTASYEAVVRSICSQHPDLNAFSTVKSLEAQRAELISHLQQATLRNQNWMSSAKSKSYSIRLEESSDAVQVQQLTEPVKVISEVIDDSSLKESSIQAADSMQEVSFDDPPKYEQCVPDEAVLSLETVSEEIAVNSEVPEEGQSSPVQVGHDPVENLEISSPPDAVLLEITPREHTPIESAL